MYYPYLRGRQYELIGLRELCEKNALNNVIPVIEPVKASSTLLSTIKTFKKMKKQIIIIRNPSVGTFVKDLNYDKEYKEKFYEQLKICNDIIINGYILNQTLKDKEILKKSVALCFNLDQVKIFNELQFPFELVFIPESSSAKRKITEAKIVFEDRFEAEIRNADYAEEADKTFSTDFFYYKDDGYEGFSDFSIVGNDYSESGFAPFAVAIHMVYIGTAEDELRIHHFVSNSNEDINNPQKKFYEALEKLVNFSFLNNEKNNTYALSEFRKIYDNGSYPGLGTIKKLSIMHHIELISKLLSEQ